MAPATVTVPAALPTFRTSAASAGGAYETKVKLTVVRESGADDNGTLVRAGLADAARLPGTSAADLRRHRIDDQTEG
jgi:hypothetical protein